MKKLALVALALFLGLALLVAAGCGGKVPQGAIATVGGVPITQAQFDQYINQAKASAGQSGQPAFPSPGTTTYNRYAAEIVNYLTQQQVVLNAADKDKLTVTDAQVQTQLAQIATQYGGTQKMYAAAKKAGMDQAQLKTYVKNSLIGQKLYQKVIGTSTPTEAQMQAYYKANKSTFDQAATRTVRHVLVKTKAEALKVQAPAHRQQHQRQLGRGRQEVLDRHRHQEQRRQPRRHQAWPDGQALRRRRLLAQDRHGLGAGPLAVRLARARGHQDHAGQGVHLRGLQGRHQEHAHQSDAAEDLVDLAGQGSEGRQDRLRGGLQPRYA